MWVTDRKWASCCYILSSMITKYFSIDFSLLLPMPIVEVKVTTDSRERVKVACLYMSGPR